MVLFFNERAIIYLLFCQSPLHTAVCFLGLRTSCLLYQRLPEEASKTSPGFPIFYYFFQRPEEAVSYLSPDHRCEPEETVLASSKP